MFSISAAGSFVSRGASGTCELLRACTDSAWYDVGAVVEEEDVLRFQVRMNKIRVVDVCAGNNQLVAEAGDRPRGKRGSSHLRLVSSSFANL